MHQNNRGEDSGFTVIEVVLALTIASLIFIVVFIALPQLQRSRRNNQRQHDTGRVLAELENYAANNSGFYPKSNDAACATSNPDSFNDFRDRYIDSDEQIVAFDPSSSEAYVYTCDPSAEPTDIGIFQYAYGHRCVGEGLEDSPSAALSSSFEVAVRVVLEPGRVYYCQDNR